MTIRNASRLVAVFGAAALAAGCATEGDIQARPIRLNVSGNPTVAGYTVGTGLDALAPRQNVTFASPVAPRNLTDARVAHVALNGSLLQQGSEAFGRIADGVTFGYLNVALGQQAGSDAKSRRREVEFYGAGASKDEYAFNQKIDLDNGSSSTSKVGDVKSEVGDVKSSSESQVGDVSARSDQSQQMRQDQRQDQQQEQKQKQKQKGEITNSPTTEINAGFTINGGIGNEHGGGHHKKNHGPRPQ